MMADCGKDVADKIQRSAKVFVRGLVKFAPALAQLAGTNFTKPPTKTLADLCTIKDLDLSWQIQAQCFSDNVTTDIPTNCLIKQFLLVITCYETDFTAVTK